MNKYQEALDELQKHLQDRRYPTYNSKAMNMSEIITIIKELVDKTIPTKPYNQMMTSCLEGTNSNRTAIYELSCRNCDSTFEENCDDLNCKYCGQALDWSNNED